MSRISKLLLVLCLAAAPAGAEIPRIIDIDGPTEGSRAMTLRELWRVGGSDEDVIFGRIADVEAHPSGKIYVLDNQLCQIVVISASGEVEGYLSRQGDGPGELRQPMGLVLLSDDVLAVGLGFPAKLVTLRLDGTPVGTHYPVGAPADGNVAVMISLQFVDGVLGATGGSIAFAPNGESHTDRFLSLGDASLSEFHRILDATTPFDPSGQRFVEEADYYIDASWALGPGGRIYAPMKRDAYEVSEFDTAGRLVRVFGRADQPRVRTDAEKSRVSPVINPGVTETKDWMIADHDARITRIMVHPDEATVWVLTPHGHQDQPDGILQTWDVFSPVGEYLRQVPIPLGHDMEAGACHLVGHGRMIVVRGAGSEVDETAVEPLEVICYEILP